MRAHVWFFGKSTYRGSVIMKHGSSYRDMHWRPLSGSPVIVEAGWGAGHPKQYRPDRDGD